MREVANAFDICRAEPRNDLLAEREENEAYLLAIPGEQYAVYFPAGGSVSLDLTVFPGDMTTRRMDIGSATWLEEAIVAAGDKLNLSAPAGGHSIVLLKKK